MITSMERKLMACFFPGYPGEHLYRLALFPGSPGERQYGVQSLG